MLVSSAQEMRDGGRDCEPLSFGGPVRVRTSLAAIATVAMVPACFIALMAFNVFALSFDSFELANAHGPSLMTALAFPAQIFLTTLLATSLPAAIFVLVSHLVARALGRNSGLAYAGAGAAIGAAFCILSAPFTSLWFVFAPAAIFGAIIGVLYRRLAGLEPVPLAKLSITSDKRALAGVDQPSRRSRPVIVN